MSKLDLKTLIIVVGIISAMNGFFFGLLGYHVGNQINSEKNILVESENNCLNNISKYNLENEKELFNFCNNLKSNYNSS